MSPERVNSNQTVVHHDSWSEGSPEKAAEIVKEVAESKDQDERERQIDRIEEKIQAAARAVVASIEKDSYGGNHDSELSMRMDESYEGEGTDLTFDGTESSYVDGTEMSFESESGGHSELHNGIDGTEVSYDDDNEDHFEHGDVEGDTKARYESDNEDNPELHSRVEDAEVARESEAVHHTEQDGVQNSRAATYESENEHHSDEHHSDQGGDSSSHHEGDIDDDVFSRHSSHSARSSLNSSDDLHSADDIYQQKKLTSPVVGEEAASSHEEEDAVSRIPSGGSYMHPIPDADRTPSKVLTRPPFRTPSSVRAMQMSSPTASIFSSPRSTKRHLPTVSRIGTPSSHTSKNRTPTRFRAKKEYPLILLHVTVLPLQWPYSHLMSSPEVPESLQIVKESWRLLHQKLGDAVLERGILLPHPQDSYEILEERLLEALELPVRPRALILKCGHYMGPQELETPSSDEEGGDYLGRGQETRRKWCDICRREVRLEDRSDPQGKKFTIKTYASNGLMRAGAWAAVWREMERVDVEIEPYVEPHQHIELERMAIMSRHATPVVEDEDHEDGFVDEEVMPDEHDHPHEPSHVETAPEQHIDAEQQRIMDEAELNKILEDERMREIYGHDDPIVEEQPRPEPSRRSSSRVSVNEDSLPELLLAAFKVAMRDSKNIAILVLSVLVLMLALRPSSNEPHVLGSPQVPEIISEPGRQAIEVGREAVQSIVELAKGMPSKIPEVVVEKSEQVIEKAQMVADVVQEKTAVSTEEEEEIEAPKLVESVEKEEVPQTENTILEPSPIEPNPDPDSPTEELKPSDTALPSPAPILEPETIVEQTS